MVTQQPVQGRGRGLRRSGGWVLDVAALSTLPLGVPAACSFLGLKTFLLTRIEHTCERISADQLDSLLITVLSPSKFASVLPNAVVTIECFLCVFLESLLQLDS